MKTTNSSLVVGIGSALVDILLQETDDFLISTEAQKGGMLLVDAQKIESVLSHTKRQYSLVPGGSACNTIIGMARLGQKTRFVGKRGNDELGETLEKTLRECGVEPLLEKSETPTGRVLSIITPDAQRSMFTFLGASSEMRPEEISAEKLKGAALVHIEGYMLFNEELIFAALKAAKKAGALISLDFASFTVVEASKKILTDIVKEYVDILLANEDEARVYTGHSNEIKALETLSRDVDTAVLKVGKRGSYVADKGKVYSFGIMGDGHAVDTTGAGDLWASGFLYGLTNGFNIDKCGKLGAACGYEVCQVIGAHIPEDGWKRIKKLV